ncbi:MAG: hypothetical protein HOM34_04120 [Planctomycetes bacterium]|jgi:hypothetical protein|nr:hypothetical protein [Planctomycetota bacterium]MBT4029472.1 hypothetical protein [Planctomycetota bacterium]MBT4560658.1 hypothetical protein [Planctomycetota bacterium]MBT5119887.1 hypothetical protein [Planctomycetota bacterium]MBT7317722.1 hypothetical protein [Planctomycetota bacterium]
MVAITAGVFALAMIGMGVGVIFSNRKLSGSCGGVGVDGESIGDCLCTEEAEAIREELAQDQMAQMASLGFPGRDSPLAAYTGAAGSAEWVELAAKPHDGDCSDDDRENCGC